MPQGKVDENLASAVFLVVKVPHQQAEQQQHCYSYSCSSDTAGATQQQLPQYTAASTSCARTTAAAPEERISYTRRAGFRALVLFQINTALSRRPSAWSIHEAIQLHDDG